jgi:hypothetical protein
MTADLPVHKAWAAVMADVTAITKDGRNQSQGFNFRGIDGVMNAVGPALRAHRVVIVPLSMSPSYRDVEVGAKRTAMREVTMKCRWRIIGPAGDHLDVEAVGEAMDAGDKGTAKAASVAYRTLLLQALTVPTHEPDPDEHTHERAPLRHGPLDGPPATPGQHAHLEAIAELGRLTASWDRTNDAWRFEAMARLRDEKGWPKKVGEYTRSQAHEALAAAQALDQEPFPVDPREVSQEVPEGKPSDSSEQPTSGGSGDQATDEQRGEVPGGGAGSTSPAPVDNPSGASPRARTGKAGS